MGLAWGLREFRGTQGCKGELIRFEGVNWFQGSLRGFGEFQGALRGFLGPVIVHVHLGSLLGVQGVS